MAAGARMAFYADADCTEPVKFYDQGRRLAPFVVKSSELHFKLHCAAAKRSACKFAFHVTPCVPGLALGAWLAEFLLSNFPDHHELDGQRLFDAVLAAVWELSAPTVQKRVLVQLLARIVRTCRVKVFFFCLRARF